MKEHRKLTEQEGKLLIKVARSAIEEKLFGKSKQEIEDDNIKKDVFWEKRGVFVTLKKQENLRGCIGHILPLLPLIEGVKENAVNAAFNDPRFPPLSSLEYPLIKVEVSILTKPSPLLYDTPQELIQKLIPLKHGVILRKGIHQATFLPQVWEQLPDKKEFLAHLCIKANLSPSEWMKGDMEVSTYEVQAFEED